MFRGTGFNVPLAGLASALAIGLVACGSSTGTVPAAGADTGTTAAGAEGNSNSGEAPAILYVDSRYHYRIGAPGHMTVNADGSAAFVGPSERLQVTVVQGAKAADVAALARDDVAGLPASTAGFHLVAGPRSVNLNGHKVEKFVYNWNAGTNQVTGKPVTLVGVRYYVPKDATTMAVITYGIAANQYDPQGADDIASTFQWQ